MFDKIRFHNEDFGPINPYNIMGHAQKLNEGCSDFSYTLSQIKRQAENDFLIDGTIQMLFPYPLTPSEQKRFYYPVIFTYCENGSNYYYKRKDDPSYLIMYTHSGGGIMYYQGKEYEIGEGDLAFLDCRIEHYYKAKEKGWTQSSLHFNGFMADEWYQEFSKWGTAILHERNQGFFLSLLENVLYTWSHSIPYKTFLISNGISEMIAYILTEISRTPPSNPIPDSYQYLKNYIDHNYSKDITLEYLADFAGVNKYHLAHEFKHYFNISPIQYLIQVRLKNATIMLKDTDLPVANIGFLCGFHDTNNFFNLFKKNYHVTPGVYRKSISPAFSLYT